MPLSTGQILKDRYRIVKLLGQGGFGAVYKAWDLNFELPCALKENCETSPEALRQFGREARLLRTLRHPNLPLVTDYFVLPGQGQYLVMDFVEGDDLQQKLDLVGGPLPETEVLVWLLNVCDALEYLHSQQPPVIHRDVKPANIKITPQGKAVLVDFGIAKVFDPNVKTTKGARAFTSGYSPPEQYGRGVTDVQSDLYSLGATAYHLLTGCMPPDSVDLLSGTTGPIKPVSTANPLISQPLCTAISNAMELRREQRTNSVQEFRQILSGIALVQSGGVSVTAPTAPIPKPMRRFVPHAFALSPWPALGIGTAVLALLVGLAFWLGRWIVGNISDHRSTQTTVTQIAQTDLVGEENQLTENARMTSTSTETTRFLVTQVVFAPTSSTLSVTTPLQDTTSTITETNITSTQPIFPPIEVSTVTVEIPASFVDKKGAAMAMVPAGEFQMGSEVGSNDEQPVHTVYLDDFYIDLFEVTNALYAQCVQTGVCSPPHNTIYFQNTTFTNHPVVYVDWDQARGFCRWRGGSLPTEAQWEKAARGGLEAKPYPWGDVGLVCTKGSDNGAQFSKCGGQTKEVGSFNPNGYGLYDMVGNVWEWVLDWYQNTYYSSSPGENPMGPSSGQYRVLRGGSWFDNEAFLKVSYRFKHFVNRNYQTIGFRCSRSP